MHFLVYANAVIPGLVLVSNLGCHTALVQRTRGQTSLPVLETVNHDSLATVKVPLLLIAGLSSDLLASFLKLAGGLTTSRITGWQELMSVCMLLIMCLLNSILSRFNQVAVARIVIS